MRFSRHLIGILLLLLPFISSAQHRTEIIAHRGYWNCPEAGFAKNSIAALRCAQEHRLWGSEFDVQMTSDSVLVIYHDKKINGKRVDKQRYSDIKDYTLENGEKLPTIDQFLEQAKQYPATKLVYELKALSSEENNRLLVLQSIAKLKEHSLLSPDRVMFISFDLGICKHIAELLPDFDVQYLGFTQSPRALAQYSINGVSYNFYLFNLMPQWNAQARDRNMSVAVWTVNKDSQIQKSIKLGVDYITSDEPLKALDHLPAKAPYAVGK